MRKPEQIEQLYIDFDGFFASVMQQAIPALRDRPVGVIPFAAAAADSTVVIACSKQAKALGCKNVMPVADARRICPDLILVTQRPDLFRRAHHALLNEIACEIPIDTVKSIDELSCRLDDQDSARPNDLAERIKKRIRQNIGNQITCSMGFAANRLLAKMACKIDKPDGATLWHPAMMPTPLLSQSLSNIPGVGHRMEARLHAAGITSMSALLATAPKQLRQLWHNVNGERMWYALHGYDIQAYATGRKMYGHSRVLPPGWRYLDYARSCSRLLLSKAARRLRRGGFYANRLYLWLGLRKGSWFSERPLACVQDDQACLQALDLLWHTARQEFNKNTQIIRLGVTLCELTPAHTRQLDLFLNDDPMRQRWERMTKVMDHLNYKFGKRVLTLGPWVLPPGGYAGGKISYTRIPSAEDFW